MKEDHRPELKLVLGPSFCPALDLCRTPDFSSCRSQRRVESVRLSLCFWDVGNGKQHKYCI
ncbi:hypothetical protein I79_010788 [Cricetulus griseus]|uniref:Uncharacterized protein n=1 Tax=Cricetulus griseus TaxID=10029 RepID=G3HJE3_CRIGR|nr:hypothetical protein I79_010788 [Cricetulus griseus]